MVRFKHNEDLRVTKTRAAIKDAFLKLAAEKSLDKISVNGISKKAMINRSTFYLHYTDKYDLLHHLEDDMLREIIQYSNLISPESIQKCYKENLPLPHIVLILGYIEDNLAFFQMISKNTYESNFYSKFASHYSGIILSMLPTSVHNALWNKYLPTFSESVIRSTINTWIKGDLQESKEDMAMMISDLLFSFSRITSNN